MVSDFPAAGQVFEYHYLWNWQSKGGETEGRKKRPCCMTLVVANRSGKHVLFIAPITSQKPNGRRLGILIPETEAHRAHLDTDKPLWVIVDELNVDVLENSYTLESRNPLGQFGAAFTETIVRRIQMVRQSGELDLAKRTD